MTHRAAILLSLFVAWPHFALAQQMATTPSAPPTTGHRLFVQSCAVCHLKPSPTAETYGPVLSRETVIGQEADARDLIRGGSERMPGFRYSLEPAQIDAIIAYLATVPPPPSGPTNPPARREEMPR